MSQPRERELLRVLYQDIKGLLNLRAIDRERRYQPVQTFCAPEDTPAITAFCRQHQDRELYFGVALRRDPTSGELANCTWLPCLFSDVDFKGYAGGEAEARDALLRCPLAPTAIVHSGGGLHPYWLLKEPIDLLTDAAAAKTWLRRLALGLGGDLASAEPARVLRIPGTPNHKYVHGPFVTVESLDEARAYALSDFDSWLPLEPVQAGPQIVVPVDGMIAEGARNATLTSLAGSMRRRGMTEAAIDAALQAENTARCRPPLDAPEVTSIARSVTRYAPADARAGVSVPEEDLARRLAQEFVRERARREVRRVLDAEARGPLVLPAARTLRDWLAEPDPPQRWRIEGWQPTGSRVLLAAQFKSGKTTLVDNLLHALLDGELWLGQAHVEPVEGRVVIFDTEMADGQRKAWLRDQRIRHDDRLIVVPLRGGLTSFNLLDADVRRAWAGWLRDADASYLTLDCLRPCLDALGLDEHTDAGRFLTAFDALLAEAGVGEGLVVTHMGHQGERARGDSRLLDWPDALWRLVRQTEDPASPRFITAYGRDVDVAEQQLAYDPQTRRLTLAGGSRRDAKIAAALPDVLAALDRADHPLGVREIQEACQDGDHPRDRVRDAVRLGVRTGAIAVEEGPRKKLLHRRGTDSTVRVCGSVRECAVAQSVPSVRCAAASVEAARSHAGNTPEKDPSTERAARECAAVFEVPS